ncbi:hypothetical protein JCM10213v2_002715 [Rhodosporidiobolus nylandii]
MSAVAGSSQAGSGSGTAGGFGFAAPPAPVNGSGSSAGASTSEMKAAGGGGAGGKDAGKADGATSTSGTKSTAGAGGKDSGKADGTASTRSQAQAKRTGIACTRCRRQKQRCDNDGSPPCQACVSRGCEASCTLGEPRGKNGPADAKTRKRRAEDDAEYSPHAPPPGPSSRRGSVSHGSEGSPSIPSAAGGVFAPTFGAAGLGLGTSTPKVGGARKMSHAQAVKEEVDELDDEDDGRATREMLPPLPLLIEGCEAFFSTYFQLGFLHRPTFLNKLSTAPQSIPPFLLLAMLAVSARFADGLVKHHGGAPTRASEIYAERAMGMVLNEVMEPTLERVQALYLLGIRDFANGQAFRSKIFQNMARQMAEVLRLHEEVAELGAIENEIRRRMWWFLTMDANLLNFGGSTSSAFDPLNVPVLLPSQEADFTFGVPSRAVQYFPGATFAAAQAHPPVAGEVSLLGALLGIIAIFGGTARAIASPEFSSPAKRATIQGPWEAQSLYATTRTALAAWTASLSPVQHWSQQTLLAYRSQGLDIGFACIWIDYHAIQILLRRAYLPEMIRALAPGSGENAMHPDATVANLPDGLVVYFARMADELVEHAGKLVELQEQVAALRPSARGATPHIAFCTYLAGTILNYSRICPWLSPLRSHEAPAKIASALSMLQHISGIWPIARRWHEELYSNIVSNPTPASMDGDPGKAAGIASADLAADQEAGLYRQFAPSPAVSTASPAHQLDAASALAAMSHDVSGQGPGPSEAGAKRFSAHLRQAPPLHAALTGQLVNVPTPAASSALFGTPSFGTGSSATPTPFNLFSPAFGGEAELGDLAGRDVDDLEAFMKLDMGDLGELNRFLVGYGDPKEQGAGGGAAGGVGMFSF